MNPKQDKKYQKQKRNKRTKKREKETERKKTKPRKRKKNRIDSTKIWYVRLSRIYVFCRDFLTDLMVSEPAGMSVGLLQLMP